MSIANDKPMTVAQNQARRGDRLPSKLPPNITGPMGKPVTKYLVRQKK